MTGSDIGYGTDIQVSEDGQLRLVVTSISADMTGYAVQTGERAAGTVTLHHETPWSASLEWDLHLLSAMDSARAIRVALDRALDSGLSRVEARIAADDPRAIRIASMAGIRREGIIRDGGAGTVLMGRLASDPSPHSHDGFTAILNAGLPTKRVICQGIVRDEHDRILLCELTYKTSWDLPGGVVEPGESPAAGLTRELSEELDLTLTPHDMLTVNWLPAWSGWDDACLLVFDLGTIAADTVMHLQTSEIRAVHWCTLNEVREQAAEATVELIEALAGGPLPHYRESRHSSGSSPSDFESAPVTPPN